MTSYDIWVTMGSRRKCRWCGEYWSDFEGGCPCEDEEDDEDDEDDETVYRGVTTLGDLENLISTLAGSEGVEDMEASVKHARQWWDVVRGVFAPPSDWEPWDY
jgi:hypothetical protein